jgi:putative restriction endonuclease
VVDAWKELGKSGFKVCRFRLDYCGENNTRKTAEDIELDYRKNEVRRKAGSVLRIVRDTRISRSIKELYSFACQVCGTAIKKGNYAEGAHIKPLGRPHNGDDSIDNILCLCPSHHVMFDIGSFSIGNDFNFIGDISGWLRIDSKHEINIKNVEYHRNSHGY